MSTVQLIIRPVSCFVFLSAHTVCCFARGTLYVSTPLAETEMRLWFLCEQDRFFTREQDRGRFILSWNASLLTTHLQASSINHYKMTERAPVPFSPFLTSPIFHSEKLKASLTHLSTSGTLSSKYHCATSSAKFRCGLISWIKSHMFCRTGGLPPQQDNGSNTLPDLP